METQTNGQAKPSSAAEMCPFHSEVILESIRDGFFILDREWRYTYANRTGAASLKTTPEELIGKIIWDVLPLAEDPRFREECTRAIEQKVTVEFEQYYESLGRWFIYRCCPVREGLVISLTDITRDRQMQQVLQDNEQRLRLVLDGGQMGRWEWDLQTDAMFWCERTYNLLGLRPCLPVTGEAFLDRVSPQDREELKTSLDKAVADRTDFHVEFRVLRSPGETRKEVLWLTLRGKVVRDESGASARMFGVLYDVTDRKQMEAELLRLNEHLNGEVHAQTEEMKATIGRLQNEVARRVLAEDKLRKNSQMLEAFFQHTITPQAFLDCSFNFIRVNDAYAQADGKTPEYFVGRNYFMLYPAPQMQEVFEEVVRTRQPYRAHVRAFTCLDGPQRVRYRNWQLTPMIDEAGEVQFLAFSLEDVTSQQEAMQELRQRARQLQQLTLELSQAEDRERKRLAEILHDDLQQVLAAAKFQMGMLSTRLQGDTEMQDLTGYINSLLKEAIGKSRNLSHELSPTVLYQSDLGETFEWLAHQVQAKHGLVVHVEVRGRIEPRSEAIRSFLYKAAQEMLFNVVKHAQVAEARLRLQHIQGRVWLTIADRGNGFDPRALSGVGGYGLMSIRERVELLGGRMRIKSAVGKGSTFLISVPDPENSAAATAGSPAERSGSWTAAASNHASEAVGRALRVLLVDDHKVVREGLAALLGSEQDIEVVGQAANGREAIDMAGKLLPDVVVMDVAMPVMDGGEATRHIKQQLPQIRVIALSMFQEISVVERMRKAGAETYLLKTSPAEELLAAIRGVGRNPAGHPPAEGSADPV